MAYTTPMRFEWDAAKDRGIALVIYMERDDDLIRIIGARFATKRERELYRQQMDQHR